MPPAIPFIGLAIAAASAGFAVKSSLDQAKAQKKQAKAQRRAQEAQAESQRIQQVRADVSARKERRKQLRQARLRKAQIIQANINAGAGVGGSTLAGAIGGISTQFGANVGGINEAQGFAAQIGEQSKNIASAQSEINRQQGKVQTSQAQAGLASSIGGVGAGIFDRGDGFTSIFKTLNVGQEPATT